MQELLDLINKLADKYKFTEEEVKEILNKKKNKLWLNNNYKLKQM